MEKIRGQLAHVTKLLRQNANGLISKTKQNEKVRETMDLMRDHAVNAKGNVISKSSQIVQSPFIRALQQQLNQLTEYDKIVRLREEVEKTDRLLKFERDRFQKGRRDYEQLQKESAETHDKFRELQDKVNRLEATPEEFQQSQLQYKKKIDLNIQVENEKKNMNQYEEEFNQTFDKYLTKVAERYQVEQTWSDKIRMLSTYVTIGITAITYVAILWRNRKMESHVESIKSANDQLKESVHGIELTISAEIKNFEHLLANATNTVTIMEEKVEKEVSKRIKLEEEIEEKDKQLETMTSHLIEQDNMKKLLLDHDDKIFKTTMLVGTLTALILTAMIIGGKP